MNLKTILNSLLKTPVSTSEAFLEYEAALNTIDAAKKTIARLRKPMGQALRAIRETENLSMRSASERVGISGPYWSEMESGIRPVTQRVLKKLRKVFNP
jgi:hypothetical protein